MKEELEPFKGMFGAIQLIINNIITEKADIPFVKQLEMLESQIKMIRQLYDALELPSETKKNE